MAPLFYKRTQLLRYIKNFETKLFEYVGRRVNKFLGTLDTFITSTIFINLKKTGWKTRAFNFFVLFFQCVPRLAGITTKTIIYNNVYRESTDPSRSLLKILITGTRQMYSKITDLGDAFRMLPQVRNGAVRFCIATVGV